MTHSEAAASVAAVIVPLVGFHWRTWWKIDRLLKRIGVEHEILIDDYCERKEMDREDLPTRHNILP